MPGEAVGRREFVAAASALAVAGWPARAQVAERQRPNVVFVFADQLQAQILNCYGNDALACPTFERLAAEGLRVDNCISQYPLCSPYRAMLLTGRYPMVNGTIGNDTAVRHDLPTIGTVFRDQGYDTGYIGKWHLDWGRDPFVAPDRRLGFDYWAVRNCAHQYFDSFYCGATPDHVPLPGYEPLAQADLAADYVRTHREQPFCLVLSWGPPHDPYRAPEEYHARYPLDQLPLPPNAAETAVVEQLLATDQQPLNDQARQRRARWREVLDNDELFKQQCLQGYCAATRALDDGLATIVGALSQSGQLDDTILVFTSDHGDLMGSHRMISKQLPFEESIRVPCLIRYPRQLQAGSTSDALLGTVDLMPTLLDLAGLDCPEVDGASVADAFRNGGDGPHELLPIMKMLDGGNPWLANGVTAWRGVRTKQHTYARLLDRGPWVLYDNLADPRQMQNLLGQPEHAATQAKLEQATNDWMQRLGDPGSVEELTAWRAERRQAETAAAPAAVKMHYELKAGDTLSRTDSPAIENRAFGIHAEVEANGANGVIVAQGGIGSGFSLYVEDGQPVFVTRHKGPSAEVRGKEALPAGKVILDAALTADGLISLAVNGTVVGEAKAPGLIPVRPGDWLQVGQDAEHPVSNYTVPNPFGGVIHQVVIELEEPE